MQTQGKAAIQGGMSTVGGALTKTGEPISMAVGGALQIGSAVWGAIDAKNQRKREKARQAIMMRQEMNRQSQANLANFNTAGIRSAQMF